MTTEKRITKIRSSYLKSSIIGFITIAFWLIETTFFLIRDGWHFKAITKEEILMDDIVSLLFAVTIYFFVSAVVGLLDMFTRHLSIKNIDATETGE